jgi:fermentation-respiration switch protein FrsA (DUF1100 family)
MGVEGVISWLARHKERIAILGIGLLADRLIVITFDFVLYPFVIWQAGCCGAGGHGVSLADHPDIWFYDWSKKDGWGLKRSELKVCRGKPGKAVSGLDAPAASRWRAALPDHRPVHLLRQEAQRRAAATGGYWPVGSSAMPTDTGLLWASRWLSGCGRFVAYRNEARIDAGCISRKYIT